MSRVRHWLFFVLLLIGCSASAQILRFNSNDYEIAPPAPLPLPQGGTLELGYGYPNNSSSAYKKMRFFLRRRDAQGTVVKEAALNADYDYRFNAYCQLKLLAGQPWLVWAGAGEKVKLGDMMAARIDPESLAAGSPKVLVAADRHQLNINVQLGKGYFGSGTSPDGKSFYTFIGDWDHKPVLLSAYDSEMNMLWQRREELPRINNNELTGIALSDDATLFLAYVHNGNGFLARATKDAFAPAIPFPFEKGTLHDLLLSPDKKGAIRIAGTYGQSAKYTNAVFIGTLDPAKSSVTIEHDYPYDPAFIALLAGDYFGSNKGAKGGMLAQYAAHFEPGDDGVMNIFGEIYDYTGQPRHASIFRMRLAETPVFSRIPRVMLASYFESDAFRARSSGDKYYFYYYDDPENLGRDLKKDPKYPGRRVVLVRASIAGDGSIERIEGRRFYE